jgi:hypothetical protein
VQIEKGKFPIKNKDDGQKGGGESKEKYGASRKKQSVGKFSKQQKTVKNKMSKGKGKAQYV